MNRAIIIIGGLVTMAVISHVTMRFAHGQVHTPGDAKVGAKIAAEGTSAGAPACVSCHDVPGNPDGSGTFPRLFNLPHDYMVKQLQDYAAGRRTNDIMTAVAQSLAAQEAADATAYYATTNAAMPKFAPADKGLVTLGEKLATVGDQSKQVPACNNCHGPAGIGQPPVLPSLAGQFAPYMMQQLSDWQKGVRKNDGGQQMSTIVKHLTDHDIAAVAAYYQQSRSSTTAPSEPPKN